MAHSLTRQRNEARKAIWSVYHSQCDQSIESSVVAYLDQSGAVIEARIESVGDVCSVRSDDDAIARHAHDIGAYSIVTSHNHPNAARGPRPSGADTQVDRDRRAWMIEKAGIEVLENLIFSTHSASLGEFYPFSSCVWPGESTPQRGAA